MCSAAVNPLDVFEWCTPKRACVCVAIFVTNTMRVCSFISHTSWIFSCLVNDVMK